MKSCVTCGMPFEGKHADDIGLEITEGPVCKFDCELAPSGVEGEMAMKSPEGIFEGGVGFFSMYTSGDKALAERLCRRSMNSLPYWQVRHFAMMDGAQATDTEHSAIIAKL